VGPANAVDLQEDLEQLGECDLDALDLFTPVTRFDVSGIPDRALFERITNPAGWLREQCGFQQAHDILPGL
jgi:hypothetical protein